MSAAPSNQRPGGAGPAPEPADQAARDRFISGVERNFSVIAPAGVGKTKAIVDRVVTIATGPHAAEWLPRLVVVTYTKKAADEMHQRARNEIIGRRVDLATLSQFNRAFFGTIHSFCVKLLRSHGHLIGLPGAIDAVENDDELWSAFVRQLDVVAPDFPAAAKRQCLRFQPLEDILKLARRLRREHEAAAIPPPGALALPRLDALLAHQAKGGAKATVERTKEALRRWQKACATDAPFVPPPPCGSTAKDFTPLWDGAFGPFDAWLKNASRQMAIGIAQAYRAFRIAKGQLTYDDQIDLALDLVRDARAGAVLRAEAFRVILDEAQDTDPAQFDILLELAKDAASAPPAPGRFCMVGDPQQSIYGSRADLAHYAAVRDRLVAGDAATEINFDVTFRCDRAIIATVNALAAPMLDGRDGQAAFYPLQARPGAGPGQAIRIDPDPPPPREDGRRHSTGDAALHEARQVARWLREQGLEKVGASTWSDVAVLCPRRRWLETMEQALREEGLVPQVHSDRSVRGDAPAYAWFTALAAIMAAPRDGFEIAGVLREVFGLSDDALARFAAGDGTRFQIETAADAAGDAGSAAPVQATLRSLARLRDELLSLPLRDAMHRLVAATSLRDRLALVDDGDVAGQELDALLTLAGVAEANGGSLRSFAATLRDGFDAELPGRPVDENAVQLITCHKAKGLQWEAVILPMLFREISAPADYPAILHGGPGRPPRIVFRKGDVGDLNEVLERRRRQEHQRLLYVALTRAKKTLVLVHDDKHFPRRKPNGSFADLLGLLDDAGLFRFNPCWQGLPQELVAPERATKATVAAAGLDLPPADERARGDARTQAAAGPARVLPYALAERQHDSEREERRDEPATGDAEGARRYGIWWHGMMEAIDWHAPPAAREAVAAAHLPACPQPGRGAREWSLLRDQDLMARLVPAGAVVHREMPFLFNRSGREWMEGVMDLAILQPDGGRWLVLDWKTNLVTPDGAEALRALYAPQLGAYAEALHAITGLPVDAGLYSTATGRWIAL